MAWSLSAKRLRFLGIRTALCALLLVIYVMVWRPVRITITRQVVYPQVAHFDDSNDTFEGSLQSGALLISYRYGGATKHLQYRPQFGFFFLVALMALLFVSRTRKYYLLLFALHGAATLLGYAFLLVGALGLPTGFIVTDAVTGYLTPALSLALVPLVFGGLSDEVGK